jgi:hypothetical protein
VVVSTVAHALIKESAVFPGHQGREPTLEEAEEV